MAHGKVLCRVRPSARRACSVLLLDPNTLVTTPPFTISFTFWLSSQGPEEAQNIPGKFYEAPKLVGGRRDFHLHCHRVLAP